MENFTPVASTLGGILIGLAAAAMLLFNGRIAGISGITGGLLRKDSGDKAWRLWFLGGLIAGGLIMVALRPETFADTLDLPLWAPAVAGLLVGVGTRMGNGCTSGHGVCGLPRFSKRSFAAVCTFMFTGGISAFFAMRWLAGGAA
ncbi:MAG: YeeE/YedE family protein [Myxococcota bacterium]|nr:YeeE/YedE family protein [Myxococcota bacterium]